MIEPPLLAVEQVAKSFAGVPVLRDMSLTLRAGERRALIGPNGAGKTTLINLISGKLLPDAGRILFKGRDVTRLPPHHRVRLGLCRSFQILSLFPEANVGQAIASAVLRRRGLGSAPFRRLAKQAGVFDEARRVAASLDLLEALDMRSDKLPYGLQRRLDVALVLAQDPDLIVLDEPAAGLSAAETRDLVATLRQTIGGRTLLLVEHDMDVVRALADQVTVLDYGRVLFEGSPAQVTADPEVRRIYLGEETA